MRVWLLLAGLLILPACAVVGPQRQAAPVADKSVANPPESDALKADANYWWYVPIKVTWPQDQDIAWHVDVLLARSVFKPVLLDHAQTIALWRFHRRAVRDNAGHQFSFIFYAPPATAASIFQKVEQNPLLSELIATHVVENLSTGSYNGKPSAAVEATSDKTWSMAMQRAWPFFAMGSSQVWLGLIDQFVAFRLANGDNYPNNDNIEALLEFYRQINAQLAETWESEGGHAFLHHLNALFGYGDVAIYERRMIHF